MRRLFIFVAVWLVLTGCTALYMTPGGGVFVVGNPDMRLNPMSATPSPVVTMTPSPVTADITPTQESATWTPTPITSDTLICNRAVSGAGVNVRAERSTNSSVVDNLVLNECGFLVFSDLDTANRQWFWICIQTVAGDCNPARQGWVAGFANVSREAWQG